MTTPGKWSIFSEGRLEVSPTKGLFRDKCFHCRTLLQPGWGDGEALREGAYRMNGGGSSTSEGHLRMQEEQRREGSAWIKLDLMGNSSSAPPPRAGHSTVSAHGRSIPRPQKPLPVHSTRATPLPPAEMPWEAPPPRPG